MLVYTLMRDATSMLKKETQNYCSLQTPVLLNMNTQKEKVLS